MTFNDQGFLSLGLAPWIGRARGEFKDWFALVDGLNADAMKFLHSVSPSRSSTRELFASVIYGRALNSFQAVVLLAERGMIGDARTLVRSCAKSAIALGGIALDENFADALIADHYRHRLTIANVFLSDAPTQQELSASQVAGLEQVVAQVNQLYPTSKPQAINWADVAQRVGVTTLYNTIYRNMSGDRAHATIEALNRHVHADDDSNIEGLKFGPESEGIVDVLSAATSALLHAMDAFGRVYKRTEIDSAVRTHMNIWKNLA